MPFAIDFGANGILFALCLCHRSGEGDETVFGGFRLRHLDSIVDALCNWDGQGRPHHTAFFDWESNRWIPLSRWKGCQPWIRCKAGPIHWEEAAALCVYGRTRSE